RASTSMSTAYLTPNTTIVRPYGLSSLEVHKHRQISRPRTLPNAERKDEVSTIIRGKRDDLRRVSDRIRGVVGRGPFQDSWRHLELCCKGRHGAVWSHHADHACIKLLQPFPEPVRGIPVRILGHEIDLDLLRHIIRLPFERRGHVGHGDRTDVRT